MTATGDIPTRLLVSSQAAGTVVPAIAMVIASVNDDLAMGMMVFLLCIEILAIPVIDPGIPGYRKERGSPNREIATVGLLGHAPILLLAFFSPGAVSMMPLVILLQVIMWFDDQPSPPPSGDDGLAGIIRREFKKAVAEILEERESADSCRKCGKEGIIAIIDGVPLCKECFDARFVMPPYYDEEERPA